MTRIIIDVQLRLTAAEPGEYSDGLAKNVSDLAEALIVPSRFSATAALYSSMGTAEIFMIEAKT